MTNANTPPQSDAASSTTDTAYRSLTAPGVFAIAWGRPILAYAVPMVLAAVLTGAAALLLPAREGLRAVNGTFVSLAPLAEQAAVWIVALVLILLAHAFGITAATALMNEAYERRGGTVLSAWRVALRRWPAVLLAMAGAFLSILLVLAFALGAVLQPVAAIIAAAVVLILLLVAAPLLAAWPRIVAGDSPWRSTLAWAWRSRSNPLLPGESGTVRGALFWLLAGTAVVRWLTGLLIGLLPATAASIASMACDWLIPSAIALLMTAILVRTAGLRSEEPLTTLVPDASAPRRLAPALVGLTLLVMPALALGAVYATSAFGITTYSASQNDRMSPKSTVLPLGRGGERAALLSQYPGSDTSLDYCEDQACGTGDLATSILATDAATLPDGSLMVAQWIPRAQDAGGPARFELHAVHVEPGPIRHLPDVPAGSKTLRPGGDRSTLFTFEAPEIGEHIYLRDNTWLTETAVDLIGDKPVIAAIVADGFHAKEAELAFLFCDDASCTSATAQTTHLPWKAMYSASGFDLVASPDGTAAVAIAQRPEEGRAPLQVVTATRSTAPHIEQLDVAPTSPDQWKSHLSDTYWGVDAQIGADGHPVLLYRPAHDSQLALYTCTDTACAQSQRTDIDSDVLGSGAAFYPPSFIIDSTGRPLIGTVNAQNRTLTAVSCLDTRCAKTRSHALAELRMATNGAETPLAMNLDPAGNPLIAVGYPLRDLPGGDLKQHATVISCRTARCGAD